MDWTTPAHGTHDKASSQTGNRGEERSVQRIVSVISRKNEQSYSLDQAR